MQDDSRQPGKMELTLASGPTFPDAGPQADDCPPIKKSVRSISALFDSSGTAPTAQSTFLKFL
jgi:hypothetical protein